MSAEHGIKEMQGLLDNVGIVYTNEELNKIYELFGHSYKDMTRVLDNEILPFLDVDEENADKNNDPKQTPDNVIIAVLEEYCVDKKILDASESWRMENYGENLCEWKFTEKGKEFRESFWNRWETHKIEMERASD